MFGSHRSRAKRGCNCTTGATIIAMVDTTAGLDVPTSGAGTHLTTCAPDGGCATTMSSTASFVDNAAVSAIVTTMKATNTLSVMAKFGNTIVASQWLFTYSVGQDDIDATTNYLGSLLLEGVNGRFGSFWEYSAGVNQEFYSSFSPEPDVWYLFTARMTIVGSNVVCELLVDGTLIATSGTLIAPTGGTSSSAKIMIGTNGATSIMQGGAIAFIDLSSTSRSDTYLKNLRAFGRAWGRDSSTQARLIPTT